MLNLLAQIRNPLAEPLNPGLKEGADINIIGNLLTGVIRVLFVGATVFFIFSFIIGGIRWIMSSGDAKQVESARNQILHALIGLSILFSLFAILKVIELVFGVSIIKLDIEALKITSP